MMDAEQKQIEAERLINEFAERLLALNGGNKIPTDWNIRLKIALTPKQKKAGQKRDYGQVASIVKQLALAADKVRKPRTKHHNPATVKNEIAAANHTSRKTVERIDDALPVLMNELGMLDNLEPELRKAYIDGIAAAICEKLREDDAIELKASQQESHRRLNRLLTPEE